MSHPAWRLLAPVLLVFWALMMAAAPARGQARESLTVDEAGMVFREVATIPEAGIPYALLQQAEGFAIIPRVIKAGFIVGGRFGRGVVVVRGLDGNWSNPVFVTLAGGGVGFQAGAQATDLILVFTSRRSIDGFLQGRGKFTLGADAAVAAGPIGRQLEAGTDVRLESEILSYSRSRGLFAGVSLEGAALSVDWQANVNYYRQVLTTSEILSRPDLPAPASASRLRSVVTQLSAPVVVVPTQPQPGTIGPGLEPIPPGQSIPLEPATSPPAGGVVPSQPAPAEGAAIPGGTSRGPSSAPADVDTLHPRAGLDPDRPEAGAGGVGFAVPGGDVSLDGSTIGPGRVLLRVAARIGDRPASPPPGRDRRSSRSRDQRVGVIPRRRASIDPDRPVVGVVVIVPRVQRPRLEALRRRGDHPSPVMGVAARSS